MYLSADTFVEVPSGSNKNNYANVDLIVEIAEAQQVELLIDYSNDSDNKGDND